MDINPLFINVLLYIWCHFIGDFLLQTNEMALNKSKSFKWLTLHALTYGLPFLVAMSLVYDLPIGIAFTIFNSAAHWVVDAITSRITARLWEKGERHWFFVVIGLDQAIHFTTLLLSPILILLLLSLFTPNPGR